MAETYKQIDEIYNYDTFRREMMDNDRHFPGGPKPGEPAPDFELPVVGGGFFRLRDYRGRRPVLLTLASIT